MSTTREQAEAIQKVRETLVAFNSAVADAVRAHRLHIEVNEFGNGEIGVPRIPQLSVTIERRERL